MRRVAGFIVIASSLLLAGCGSKQSELSTASKQSHDIGVLWWWMFGAAAIVFFGAVAMLGVSWVRRATKGLPFVGERESVPQALVLVFGIAIPVVALVTLFGVADVYLVGETSPPDPSSTTMTIDVIGHQWWWEVRYPSTGAVTANEIHMPVNTRVNVVATTGDVIHSLWVPAVNRKIDMIPGYRNRVLFDADRTGVFRGQCAQFCGFQHARMALKLFVQTPSAFHAWLTRMSAPARSPAGAKQRTGEHVFMTSQCESCHRIAGTPAQGTIGPDLTHVASRTTLASDTIANTPSELAAWIRNPQAIKPGDRMPDLGLPNPKVAELVSYLESLR
jgi:cytochrome c oxidase subunit 2